MEVNELRRLSNIQKEQTALEVERQRILLNDIGFQPLKVASGQTHDSITCSGRYFTQGREEIGPYASSEMARDLKKCDLNQILKLKVGEDFIYFRRIR